MPRLNRREIRDIYQFEVKYHDRVMIEPAYDEADLREFLSRVYGDLGEPISIRQLGDNDEILQGG